MSNFHWLFLGICFLAALQDFLYFKIPNYCVGALIILFIIKVIVLQDVADLYFPLLVFAGVLTGGFVLYSFKLLGAGDAKLLAATAMWASEFNLLAFVVFTALAGGIISLLYLWLGRTFESTRVLAVNLFSSVLVNKGQKAEVTELASAPKRVIPYGVAIFVGSVVVTIQSGMR